MSLDNFGIRGLCVSDSVFCIDLFVEVYFLMYFGDFLKSGLNGPKAGALCPHAQTALCGPMSGRCDKAASFCGCSICLFKLVHNTRREMRSIFE